jgi:hypothetical protein
MIQFETGGFHITMSGKEYFRLFEEELKDSLKRDEVFIKDIINKRKQNKTVKWKTKN